jgi:O-antigen/teichoic acid export membrane protein
VTFFLWLLVLKDGLVAGAAFQALLNIAAIARPVAVGIENILVPEIARRKGTMSFHELASILWHCAWASGALIVPVFAVILLAPQWTLGLFYGSDAPYTRFPGELRILIWVYVTYPIAAIFSATLKAYGASEGLMKMQLYPALTAVILGPFLILRMGLLGACLTWLATGLVCTLFGLLYVARLRRVTASHETIRQAV